jgi:hypothetical protein
MRLVLAILASVMATKAVAEELYLPPSAFVATAEGVGYGIDQGGLGCIRLFSGTAFFVAAVPAPPGKSVQEVTALLEDVNPDAFGMVSLVRRRETSFELLVASQPSRGGVEVESVSIRAEPPVSVKPNEALLVQVLLTGSDVCLHGARVKWAPAP